MIYPLKTNYGRLSISIIHYYKKKNTHYQLSLNIISIDILNPSIPRRCPRVSPRSPALLRPVAAASGHRGAARGNGPARLRPEERRHGLGMSTIHEQSIAPVLYDWMDTTTLCRHTFHNDEVWLMMKYDCEWENLTGERIFYWIWMTLFFPGKTLCIST